MTKFLTMVMVVAFTVVFSVSVLADGRCGSCVVSARAYRNPYIKTGYSSFYSYPRRSTQQRYYKPYGHRRYAQPYVRPRPYTRRYWIR